MKPAWILGAALPDLMTGDLYLRWYMYVPAEPAVLDIATVHVVESVAPYGGVILGIRNGGLSLTCSESGDSDLAGGPIPRDRWA